MQYAVLNEQGKVTTLLTVSDDALAPEGTVSTVGLTNVQLSNCSGLTWTGSEWQYDGPTEAPARPDPNQVKRDRLAAAGFSDADITKILAVVAL